MQTTHNSQVIFLINSFAGWKEFIVQKTTKKETNKFTLLFVVQLQVEAKKQHFF